MNIINIVVVACWSIFVLYWLVSAIGVKRDISARGVRRGMLIRFVGVVLILAIIEVMKAFGIAIDVGGEPFGAAAAAIGTALVALGIGLAIWARVYLGRNWGMPMTKKEGAELIMTGPYSSIRHPIYTGLIVSMIGSALVEGVVWALIMIFFGLYFIYSARYEDRLMLERFPNEYPAYKARTKMLIPFIF